MKSSIVQTFTALALIFSALNVMAAKTLPVYDPGSGVITYECSNVMADGALQTWQAWSEDPSSAPAKLSDTAKQLTQFEKNLKKMRFEEIRANLLYFEGNKAVISLAVQLDLYTTVSMYVRTSEDHCRFNSARLSNLEIGSAVLSTDYPTSGQIAE